MQTPRWAVVAIPIMRVGPVGGCPCATFPSRAALHLENLALQHSLGVLQRSVQRTRLAFPNRLLRARLLEICHD